MDYTVKRKRGSKSKYHYRGQVGSAIDRENTFRAADKKVPIFITNIHKGTKETDKAKYVQMKTQEIVKLEKISMKTERDYDAYKFYVTELKLSMFLDENLWPRGLIFRRFVHFKNRTRLEDDLGDGLHK